MLLDNGAKVNIHGGKHGSALEVASSEGDENIVHILLEKGGDMYIQDALQAAASEGHDEVVALLKAHCNTMGEQTAVDHT